MATWGSKKNYGLPDSVLDAVREVIGEKKLDPVDQKALKKDFDDRKDQDLDNDGDVDKTDKYLHNRRKTVSKAIGKGKKDEVDTDPKLDEMKDPKDALRRAMLRKYKVDSDSELATLLRRSTGHQVPKQVKDEITKKMAQRLKGIPHKLDIHGSGVDVMVSKSNLAKAKSMIGDSKRVKVISEEVELTEREDTATLVAKALKKMGVKPNAKEDEVIKKIPDVLKKMGMQQALNMMNRSKDYRNDMLGDILDSLRGM